MSSAPSDDELDETLGDLRRAMAAFPQPLNLDTSSAPGHVVAGARWVHDWATMDAELAALTEDSASSASPSSVRSSATLRQLLFASQSTRITIDIEQGPAGASVTGRCLPEVAGTVHLAAAGSVRSVELDEFGTFFIDGVGRGVAMAHVTTSDVTIRLEPFEI